MVRKNKTECKMTFRNEEPHVNKSFPRVRGDVPDPLPEGGELLLFSPRARGCSPLRTGWHSLPKVFPACAGMFPHAGLVLGGKFCFPRVRGDVPV